MKRPNASRLVTFADWANWVFQLPGGPKVFFKESFGASPELRVYRHQKHSRWLNSKAVKDLLPVGVRVQFHSASHVKLRELTGMRQILAGLENEKV